MKFCVCIKQVPDVAAPMQIRDGEIAQDTGRMVLDAYSASAVEEALVLVEKIGGSVEVVLVGPLSAREAIRKALAMGAEKGTHILTDEEVFFDSSAYAEILDHFLRTQTFDVILCGKQSQDTDAGLIGSMLAQRLSIAYASNAVDLAALAEEHLIAVTRQGDTGQEYLKLRTPCLVTCSNDMNDPRIPSLKGIMQSKKKEVAEISLQALGFDAVPEVRTTTVQFEQLPERTPGRMIEGDTEQAVAELVRLLQDEAKVV